MNDTKIILLIGRSGRGKSTLANVLTNTNNFKESSGSVSETKEVQCEQFVDGENSINYQIIDTPGIGDTKMSDNEVLNIIAKAVYLGKDGISQVFFVNDGRFDQYEMATYDLLRTIIFDNDITKHTTIVRTRFPEFRDDEEYQKDIDSMTKEAQEKETELRKNIADKKKELESLPSSDEQYQRLSEEIKKAEKELTVTNLAKIIESCQGRIIYVDNPSLEVKDANKLKMNKEDREDSREILLEHLKEHCLGDSYKPENLKKLSEDIADDYFQYLNKKAELQKELDEEMKRLSSRVSQPVQTSSSQEDGQAELIVEETEKKQAETNIGIIEIQEIIVQLQDKKARLKKEIQEKEKIIHQKVLKHIFNNYEAINKELGGDIFLNSVAGDHPWSEIHSEFANKELLVKWLSQGFDYFQTQKWATALIDFNPQIDADFCAWLRDKKQLTVDGIKRASYPQNIERLRNEYVNYLQKETEILDRHSKQLPGQEGDWKEIHKDFSEYYQQQWKSQGFTYQQAKEWIAKNLTPKDYELASYLKQKKYQPSTVNLKETKKEFQDWIKIAQNYLDFYYPLEGTCWKRSDYHNFHQTRQEITRLDIREKNLLGFCALKGFVNLEKLWCNDNQLTSLDLSDCVNLQILWCSGNQLSKLDFLNNLKNPEELTKLHIGNNIFLANDLTPFSKFINLEELCLDNNSFFGSLEPLERLVNLKWLDISDTDIDSGLECLSEELENFSCLVNQRPQAKVKVIASSLASNQRKVETDEFGNIKNFSQKLRIYKQKLQNHQQAQIFQSSNFLPVSKS